MKRLVSIDIAKAICIILVVIGHYHPDNAPQWYHITWEIIYSFHMPLFFFASGYIYIATRKETDTYIKPVLKKIKRLLIPYFSTSFIIITLKLLSERNLSVENPVSYKAYLEVFCYPSAGVFLWFVWVLFTIFLIIPLFKTPRQRLFLFGVGLFLYYLPGSFDPIFCLNKFKIMFIYFCLGTVVKDYNKYLKSIISINPVLPILLFAAALFLKFHLRGSLEFLVDMITAVAGTYAVCSLSLFINKKGGYIKTALISISFYIFIIYLFHTTFEGLGKAILQKTGFTETFNNLYFTINAFIIITIGIIGPILLQKYILTHSRITRFLFGIK